MGEGTAQNGTRGTQGAALSAGKGSSLTGMCLVALYRQNKVCKETPQLHSLAPAELISSFPALPAPSTANIPPKDSPGPAEPV